MKGVLSATPVAGLAIVEQAAAPPSIEKAGRKGSIPKMAAERAMFASCAGGSNFSQVHKSPVDIALSEA
jgi:hypothetical protein